MKNDVGHCFQCVRKKNLDQFTVIIKDNNIKLVLLNTNFLCNKFVKGKQQMKVFLINMILSANQYTI